MASRGSQKLLRNGLTQKENAFKNKILEQITTGKVVNATKAALEVYDTTDPKVAGDIGSTNLAKPEIKEQIEKALEDNGVSPSFIVEELKKMATVEAKITGDVKLRSLMEFAKVLGMYPDKKSMHLNLNLKGKVGTMSFEAYS